MALFSEALDHYSKGAMREWAFKKMSGVEVKGGAPSAWPRFSGEASSRQTSPTIYDSPYGRIESRWEKTEGG